MAEKWTRDPARWGEGDGLAHVWIKVESGHYRIEVTAGSREECDRIADLVVAAPGQAERIEALEANIKAALEELAETEDVKLRVWEAQRILRGEPTDE